MTITDKAKRISLDMVINIGGTGIALVILQLFINPRLAQIVSADAYGEMQSVMSIIYLVGGTLGGALSTTRLIRNNEYRDKQLAGDFNVICAGGMAIVLIALPLIMLLYLFQAQILEVVLITVIGLLNLSVNYLSVGFRLELNYKKIFISKLLGALGYVLGYAAFLLTGYWQWVFILAETVCLIYLVTNTNLVREPIRRTELFSGTTKAYGSFGISLLLGKSLTYFDKLLLFPLLGGEAVSIYFVANVFGKLIIMVLEPITNVILSYISREAKISASIWKTTIILGSGFCLLMYFACLIVCKPVLFFFYPQWAAEALKILPIALLSLSVASFVSIIAPFSLKALEPYKQIIISGASLAVYIILALLLYKEHGLIGCSWALLAAYLIKLALIFILCRLRYQNEKE